MTAMVAADPQLAAEVPVNGHNRTVCALPFSPSDYDE